MKSKVHYALIAAAVMGLSNSASAANAPGEDAGKEKCYGISAKGKNDCASNMHSCAGQGSERGADDWIYLPEGTCQKISGGVTRSNVK